LAEAKPAPPINNIVIPIETNCATRKHLAAIPVSKFLACWRNSPFHPDLNKVFSNVLENI
jgi:hypothetical protein